MRSRNYNERNKPIGTWVTKSEQARLRMLAKAHKVSMAAYLRSIVVDAIAEDTEQVLPIQRPQLHAAA